MSVEIMLGVKVVFMTSIHYLEERNYLEHYLLPDLLVDEIMGADFSISS